MKTCNWPDCAKEAKWQVSQPGRHMLPLCDEHVKRYVIEEVKE